MDQALILDLKEGQARSFSTHEAAQASNQMLGPTQEISPNPRSQGQADFSNLSWHTSQDGQPLSCGLVRRNNLDQY